MVHNAIAMRSVVGEVAGSVLSAVAGPMVTTTSLACYLQKGTDVTWQWGLKADNNYYVLKGSWITTPFTGLTKFVTTTPESELVGAADRAIAYYERTGYRLLALFAADGAGGYNYPVLVGSKELYPKF